MFTDTGPEEERNDNTAGEPVTDFDYVTAALAYAMVEDLELSDFESILPEITNGKEFDAAVSATIWLYDIVEGNYESF